ncbi:hypothetical protein ACQKLX_10100 [Bosea sp. NPDC003192]|uniref:hypothetical protein n=1 Tax=Bosea sp. NPDC003192 TaxID=3390551 RepID=UPI003D071D0D
MIRRRIYRRKLQRMLARVPDQAFFTMCWATHAIQSGREAGVERILRFPPDAVVDRLNHPLSIHPWAIETLLNEALIAPKALNIIGPISACSSFSEMSRFFQVLNDLENEEHLLTPPAGRGIANLARISQRQFEWQRGFLSLPQVFRAGYLYGGPHARAHFERKHGFTFEAFTFTCFAIHAALMEAPCVRLTDGLEAYGFPRSVMAPVVAAISRPIQEARQVAAELRQGDGETAYKISILRTHPCVTFDDLIYAPLPELVSLRGSAGIFYDIVGGPPDATKEVGRQFERYTERLLTAMTAPLRVSGEYKYSFRRQQQPTPDILVYDQDELALIVECKAVRMPLAARYSSVPDVSDANGYDELAWGVRQIWRFASHVRRGLAPMERLSPAAIGMIVTLDTWLSMAPAVRNQVLRKAGDLADQDPEIREQDRIPIAFALIDDLESSLSVLTAQQFLATVRAATKAPYDGWLLFSILQELFPERGRQRPYPFEAEINQYVPWWKMKPGAE